jgi:broad specificity phosphatase PhoE
MGILRPEQTRDGSNVPVVAPAGVNRIILYRLLEIPLNRLFSLAQEPGCLNIVEFGGGQPRLVLLNQQPRQCSASRLIPDDIR